mgnify:FL=1
MPLYDFRCRDCGAERELLVRAAAESAGPACGGAALDRLPSLPAVRSDATRDVVGRYTARRDAAQARERVNEQRNYERNHD